MKNKPQLILLHFAGGSFYSYQFLLSRINADVGVHVLELPGRGKRCDEKLLDNRADAVQDLLRKIKAVRNSQPYVLYGHSLGAILGLPLVYHLEQEKDAPMHFVVSGNAGPNAVEKKNRSTLPKKAFIEELKKLGGGNDAFYDDESFFSFFEPILRADFKIAEEGFSTAADLIIDTPVYALMGDSESDVHAIENWRKYTRGKFSYEVLPGNHFFIYQHPERLAEVIRGMYH